MRRALLFVALSLLVGCGEKPPAGPETVPLAGKIVFTKGGSVKDLADHSIAIQFENVENPQMQAFGTILDDGTFTMVTQVETRGKPGVVPGTHRVRLNADDTSARFVAPRFLDYKTSGITVKAPPDKEVIIEVWR
jgi:hypothetical protein